MKKATKNKKWSSLNVKPKFTRVNRKYSNKDVNVDNLFERIFTPIKSFILQEFTAVVDLIVFTIAAISPILVIVSYSLVTWIVYHYCIESPIVIILSLWIFFKYIFVKDDYKK